MIVFVLIFVITGLLLIVAKVNINPLKDLRSNMRIATGVTFLLPGFLHFWNPEMYFKMMPPFLPSHLFLIYLSGFLEILGGIGLTISKTKRWASYGLVLLLLVAIIPSNVYMVWENVKLGNFMDAEIFRWLKLPVHFALIWIVWWVGKDE